MIEHYNKKIAVDVNDDMIAPQSSLPTANNSGGRSHLAEPQRWDENRDDVVAARAEMPGKKPVKTVKHQTSKSAERKSPEKVALATLVWGDEDGDAI